MTDPKQLVQINLPNKRMYRERHEDRVALTVGPGLVTVPRWVANEWGFQVPEPEPEPDPVSVSEEAEADELPEQPDGFDLPQFDQPESEPEPIEEMPTQADPEPEAPTATPKPKRKSTKKAS